MRRSEALSIAQVAYRDIRSVIESWESEGKEDGVAVFLYRDGCISIDEHLFTEQELMESEL